MAHTLIIITTEKSSIFITTIKILFIVVDLLPIHNSISEE